MIYLQSEHLKHKRTFTRTLIILAPLITALLSFLAPLWFQYNFFNWWYILLYPGFLTLICVLVEQRDNGKLKYQSVFALPVSIKKVWAAKIGVAGMYTCAGNFMLLLLNLLGGFAILVMYRIPLTIGVWQAAAGTVCIILASLWQIPWCLWLSKKTGIFLTVILNAGLGSVLGVWAASTSLWLLCPYSWTPHLMISVLGILPNGELTTDASVAMPLALILLPLFLSCALFAVLSYCTAKWFEKQEVGP